MTPPEAVFAPRITQISLNALKLHFKVRSALFRSEKGYMSAFQNAVMKKPQIRDYTVQPKKSNGESWS